MTGPDESSFGRRGFFRQALAGIMRPIGRSRGHLSALSEGPSAQGRALRLLRPPGAIDEAAFVETCQRCGKCVEACPADAIFPLTSAFDDNSAAPAAAAPPSRTSTAHLRGTPAIDPSLAPCVVCTDLACTHVCPSGALLPILTPADIRMGTAVVDVDICVRSAGDVCTECVAKCPMGPTAIAFPAAGPPAVLDACVGCGVCEFYCPTTPKAIRVERR